ncbi:hypothetical protein F5Y16DRAFT_400683 [Xylariaceae sp. FL0255]|nr:hypothetical protein F5Y16DRAFT_400683 [Xylariaceae sp. FL0255]
MTSMEDLGPQIKSEEPKWLDLPRRSPVTQELHPATTTASSLTEKKINNKKADITSFMKESKSQADLELEIRARIEAEIAAAAEAAEAQAKEAQFKESFETLKLMVDALHEKDVQREQLAAYKEKAPIRFKDAVGRKLSFPFHICKSWQGIEDLIKQAFLHVDVLGPHVQAGHYDLIGPDGEIILPQIWEKLIQPDWAVTMHMWPIDHRPSIG